MTITNSIQAIKAYGGPNSRVQEEALRARHTDSIEDQVRIAENSNHRLVLLNLAMNKNISEEAVEALFDRDIPDLTKRLENLGYKKPGLF